MTCPRSHGVLGTMQGVEQVRGADIPGSTRTTGFAPEWTASPDGVQLGHRGDPSERRAEEGLWVSRSCWLRLG